MTPCSRVKFLGELCLRNALRASAQALKGCHDKPIVRDTHDDRGHDRCKGKGPDEQQVCRQVAGCRLLARADEANAGRRHAIQIVHYTIHQLALDIDIGCGVRGLEAVENLLEVVPRLLGVLVDGNVSLSQILVRFWV